MITLAPAIRLLSVVPVVVWLAVVVQVGVGAIAATAVPTLHVPDEAHHLDLAEAVATSGAVPDVGERNLAPTVQQARAASVRNEHHTVDNAVPREERRALDALRPEVELASEHNRATQHPPLYYGLSGAVVRSVHAVAHLSWDQHIWLYRILNVALVAPLPVIAFALARRLGVPRDAQLVAALFPLAIPAYVVRGVPMVNNDALLILLGAGVLLLIVRVVTGDRSWRTSLVLGALVGLAMMTKAYGLVMGCTAAVGYLAAALKTRQWRDVVALGTRAAAGVGVAATVGGWWWARNVAIYGTLQPAAADRASAPIGFQPDVLEWGGVFVKSFITSFWFFGPAPLPGRKVAAAVVATAAVVVVVAVALVAAGDRRLELGVVVIAAAALIAGAVVWSFGAYAEMGRVAGARGRYLYPAIAGLGALFAAGVGWLPERVRRWAPPLLSAVATALLLAQLRIILLRFYRPGPGWAQRLEALYAWSPWPPWVLTLMTLGTAAAVLALLAAATVAAMRWSSPLAQGSTDDAAVIAPHDSDEATHDNYV